MIMATKRPQAAPTKPVGINIPRDTFRPKVTQARK